LQQSNSKPVKFKKNQICSHKKNSTDSPRYLRTFYLWSCLFTLSKMVKMIIFQLKIEYLVAYSRFEAQNDGTYLPRITREAFALSFWGKNDGIWWRTSTDMQSNHWIHWFHVRFEISDKMFLSKFISIFIRTTFYWSNHVEPKLR
jgi:hypothetical protein